MDIKNIIDKIGLPDKKGAYAVHGSAPLYVKGMRGTINDLDITTSPETFYELSKKYPDNLDKHGEDDRIFLKEGPFEIEIFKTWWGGMPTDIILDTAERVNGVWYANLYETLKWKKKRNKEKDKPDIEAVEEYLESHPEYGVNHPDHGILSKESNMNKLASILDDVAGSLESKGMIKEAYYLDIIANTLEQQNDKPAVGLNKFAERHLDSNFAGTKLTRSQMDKLVSEVNRKVSNNQMKPGYADYVKIVTIKDPSIKSPIAKITPDNEDKLKTHMTKRRDFEEEYEERYFDSKDVQPIPSDHVDVILYSKEQLESEPGGDPTGSDWDIISINAEPTPSGTPMSPETIRRNMKGKEFGGSGHQHSKEELAVSDNFWKNHAKIL